MCNIFLLRLPRRTWKLLDKAHAFKETGKLLNPWIYFFSFCCGQCCGSMTFWGGSGSGSADPRLWLMDPDSDPDPAIFVIDLQDARKKQFFNTNFSTYYFLKVHLHHFSKIKSQKESQNSTRNQGFPYYFCMMKEGSGSIPLTSGSGSGSWRPKNMWIRIRIWIRNTGCGYLLPSWIWLKHCLNMQLIRNVIVH